MIKICQLKENPEYCKKVAEYLFNEWSDIYIKHTSYKNIELLYKDYIIKNLNNYIIPLTFILLNNNELIGCYSLNLCGLKLFISDVYIDINNRNKGYAKLMINDAIEYIKKKYKCYSQLFLYTSSDKLINFYNKFGFKSINERDKYDRQLMVLDLYSINYEYFYILITCLIILIIYELFSSIFIDNIT
jgi:GNAT superfamily N-acetyltransferase